MNLVDVIHHAETMGLRVVWTDLGPHSGELHAEGLVLVNKRRREATQAAAIAHECGHWVHGHDWRVRHDKRRDERQANLYAAGLLIDQEAARTAARVYEGDERAIAKELGVPIALLRLWVDSRALSHEVV